MSYRRATKLLALLAFVAGASGLASSAWAVPISVIVGDNDGYGLGIPDNGSLGAPVPPIDNRSAGEAVAVNGAQITDVYSAIFPCCGPNGSSTASVFFPFAGILTSASLTIDMGDFQSTQFGPILADINGVPLLFAFQDGYGNSVVRSFNLNAAQLLAANLVNQVILNLDHAVSNDYISFDYFELAGNPSQVPIPAAAPLLISGLAAFGLVSWRRRKRAESP